MRYFKIVADCDLCGCEEISFYKTEDQYYENLLDRLLADAMKDYIVSNSWVWLGWAMTLTMKIVNTNMKIGVIV